jgi:hypothetical protein
MVTQLDTIPASRDVTTDSLDTWSVDFANALQAGETVANGAAALYEAMPGSSGAAVSGFVTQAQTADTTVRVTWTGSVLARFGVYRLETRAILNTGAVIELLTTIRCVA